MASNQVWHVGKGVEIVCTDSAHHSWSTLKSPEAFFKKNRRTGNPNNNWTHYYNSITVNNKNNAWWGKMAYRRDLLSLGPHWQLPAIIFYRNPWIIWVDGEKILLSCFPTLKECLFSLRFQNAISYLNTKIFTRLIWLTNGYKGK